MVDYVATDKLIDKFNLFLMQLRNVKDFFLGIELVKHRPNHILVSEPQIKGFGTILAGMRKLPLRILSHCLC